MRNPFHWLKLFGAFARLSKDPRRLESVFEMSKALMKLATMPERRAFVDAMREAGLSVDALRCRPRLGRLDLDAMRALPDASLGGAYARFMKREGLDPASIPLIDPNDRGDDFEFLAAHFYETHDLWHVVTGFTTDAAGELGLQAFYAMQFPNALEGFILSAGFAGAALRETREARKDDGRAGLRVVLESVERGVHAGRGARGFLGRDWKREWERPLMEVRTAVGLS